MKKTLIVLAMLCLASPLFAQHAATLSWVQSNSPNISSNNVYRSAVSGGPYTQIYASTVPIITYIDTPLADGTYYYVVTAVAGQVESPYSGQLAVVVADINAPTGLTGKQTK